MIKAAATDRNLVVEILTRSFDRNQSVNYIVHQGDGRLKAITALMAYSFDLCCLFGDVWLSEDRNACALVLYPHKKRVTVKSVWLDIRLIIQAIGLANVAKVLDREKKIKNKQPQEPMAYLWFIGVDKHQQNQGIGSRLLQDVMDHAADQHLPVCLETSTLQNLPWYQKNGFEVYDELLLSYSLYFLRKKHLG
ncbi:GNAT family N-acetyltransferase [Mucilaginibacter sp. PAMB04274]|uniref:GNAT family N-acetyltransferase n=1 Tax=Mucilaginibacter sp. PAMB04274 TaxID=3138568 RepID=UPI0031F70BF0